MLPTADRLQYTYLTSFLANHLQQGLDIKSLYPTENWISSFSNWFYKRVRRTNLFSHNKCGCFVSKPLFPSLPCACRHVAYVHVWVVAFSSVLNSLVEQLQLFSNNWHYYTSDSQWKIWLVENIQPIHNTLWTWHDKCNICCRYCIYRVKFNVFLVTKPLGVFSWETKWLNALLLFLRMNYMTCVNV